MNNLTNDVHTSPIVFQYVYSQQEQRGFIVAIYEGVGTLVLAKQGSYGLADRGWHSLQSPVVGDWQKLEDVRKAYGLGLWADTRGRVYYDFQVPLKDNSINPINLINPHYRETLKEHFKYLLKVQTESTKTTSIYIYDYDNNEIRLTEVPKD